MNNLDSLLERNKKFAAQQSDAGTQMPWLPSALPNVKAIIIGCADMRVDPAHVLGTRPGEALVMRNIGGRITPGLLQQWGYLRESVRLLVRFLEAAESSTSSFFTIPIAASLALPTIRPCYRSIFKCRKLNSRRKELPILVLPSPSTLLCCGRFQDCQARG